MTAGEQGQEATNGQDPDDDLEFETWEALRRLRGRKEAERIYAEEEALRARTAHPEGRWVNLDEYLDGEYVAPTADLGAVREDAVQFLYPGKWHTMIGLTTAGKTFWALWQAKAVMQEGEHVIYVHFEEANPAGTVARLLHMGADKEMIRKQFHWPASRPWSRGEMADEIERLSDPPTLAVLDGINAACGDHGWNVSEPQSVGQYRQMFVAPLVEIGCAVLSLGHPVKNPGRQTESYSYGAAGWLNDVDGVSYRLKASKDNPISRGKEGRSWLYSVKDRYGDVERWGVHQDEGDMPWYFQGSFIVDDTETGPLGQQRLTVTIPALEAGNGLDKYDVLGQKVRKFLEEETQPNWKSQNDLDSRMRARDIKFPRNDLVIALQRLTTST